MTRKKLDRALYALVFESGQMTKAQLLICLRAVIDVAEDRRGIPYDNPTPTAMYKRIVSTIRGT